jgi:hypothetical protein
MVIGVLSIPQPALNYLAGGEELSPAGPIFILTAASIKFYALLAILAMLTYSARSTQCEPH